MLIQNVNAKKSPFAQLIKAEPEMVPFIKEGDIIEGAFLRKTARAGFFDLGRFGTGIVFGVEFLNARDIIKNLKPSEVVNAKVLDVQGEEGCAELSLREAGRQKVWQELKELREQGEVVKVKILNANSGGLIADVQGVSAFLPVSQLSNEHYPRVEESGREKILEELKKFIGQELGVKVIDVNPHSGKLIISEREITDENVKELLAHYAPGQVVEGIISGVADFGAFMRFTDNPQVEGLIHISELDHRLVGSPRDVVQIGDTVKVKILEIKESRVTLSLKALKTDPWLSVESTYKAGQEVQGTIFKFNPFGAFINLDPEIQGLIHVSEFGSVEEMKTALEVGKPYTFLIESVKPQEKRLILKLKKAAKKVAAAA